MPPTMAPRPPLPLQASARVSAGSSWSLIRNSRMYEPCRLHARVTRVHARPTEAVGNAPGGGRGGMRRGSGRREEAARPWQRGEQQQQWQGRERQQQGRERQQRDLQGPSAPRQQQQETALRSRDIRSTARGEAIRQLLRIEEEGAYAGLVGGHVTAAATGSNRTAALGTDTDTDAWDTDGGDDSSSNSSSSDSRGTGSTSGTSSSSGGGGGGRGAAPEGLDDRDRRLVKELVAGVTRWQRRLDYQISEVSDQSANRLEPAMRQVLRLGLYELTHLQAPPHIISEHVELAKTYVRPNAAPMANAVLRKAVRRMEAGELPDPTTIPEGKTPRDKSRRLSLIHSHPPWLVARWLKTFGEEATVALLKHGNARPTYSLRANATALDALSADQSAGGDGASYEGDTPAAKLLQLLRSIEGVSAEPSPLMPSEFVRVTAGLQAVLQSGLVTRGIAAVQDESTGLVVQLLDPQPGETLLDACAAPGNKTLLAAARMRGQGRIVAMDVSARRLQALDRAAARQGHASLIATSAADLRTAPEAAARAAAARGGAGALGSFDRVLLDAPCSGTGVLAKRADLRWRRTPEQLPQLTALQDDLLDAAAAFVRPGGLLVYSTCSIEPEECGDRVAAFLSRPAGKAFRLEPPPLGLMPEGTVTGEGYLVTLPHVHGGADGAFGARLRRSGGDN